MENNTNKLESRRSARNHIFNIIFQLEFHSDFDVDNLLERYYSVLDTELEMEKEFNDDIKAPVIDKDFVSLELNGILSDINAIDEEIKKHCRGWSIERLNKVDLAILRIAVYEIMFNDDIPMSVSANEAVELSKKYGSEKSASFVNGVLASVIKIRTNEEKSKG